MEKVSKEEFNQEKEKIKDFEVSLSDSGFFEKYLNSKKLSESSIELYSNVITKFILGNPDLTDINSYNNFLLKKAIKKRSNYCYYALKYYIKWKITDVSLRNRILENMIIPEKKDPVYSSSYLTPGRREKIISMIKSEKHQIIASLQNATGARAGDIIKIKRGNITYEAYKDKVVMKIDIIGKRGKRNPKFIFDTKLQDRILNFIEEHNFDLEYYFVDFNPKKDKELTMNQIFKANYIKYWRDLKKALEKIGLDRKVFSTHDWRRCVARDIYTDKELGNDVQILQQFLGHARADTTLKYLRTSGLSTIQVSEKLSERKN